MCVRVLLASWWTKLLRWDFWFSFWWSPEGKKLSESVEGKPIYVCVGATHQAHELSSCECFEPNFVPFYMGTTFSPCNFSFSQLGVCVCVPNFPRFFRRNRSWLSPDFPYIFDVTFELCFCLYWFQDFRFSCPNKLPFLPTRLPRGISCPSHVCAPVASLLATWKNVVDDFQSVLVC